MGRNASMHASRLAVLLVSWLLVSVSAAEVTADQDVVEGLFEQLTAATGHDYLRYRAELLKKASATEPWLDSLLATELSDWRRRVVAVALLKQLRQPESFGQVAAIIDEAKAHGTRRGPNDVSSLAINLGVRKLGAGAIPEALEILVARAEPDKVLGALLRAVAVLADESNLDAGAAICAFLWPRGAGGDAEETDPLAMEALEALRLLGSACPGAFERVVEVVESPASSSYRYVAAQVAGQTGSTQAQVDLLFALLEREQDEAVRRALVRSIQKVQERCN